MEYRTSQTNTAIYQPRSVSKSHEHSDAIDHLNIHVKSHGSLHRTIFMSEFFGTFLFVFLAQCGATSLELTGSQNDILARQFCITLVQGMAYMLACMLTLDISGAHLNPAFSVASACYGYSNWTLLSSYLCGQYLGSFVAAICLHVTYGDKITQRHNEGLLNGPNSTLRAHGNILSTGKLFSSFPPTEVSLIQLCTSYTIASAYLMLLFLAIQESNLLARKRRCMIPIYLAITLTVIQAAFSANGGPVLNPAQDLSPRVYVSMFGWGKSAFNLYHSNYWWLGGIFAPHIGGLIGFGLYRLYANLARN